MTAKVYEIITTVNDHPELMSVSIYFSGCDANPKCEGCHNPQLWEPDAGRDIPYEQLKEIVVKKLEMLLLQYEKVSLAYLGGEPLAIWHREVVKRLSKDIKEVFGDRVVQILYTWRTPYLIKRDFADYVQNIDEFVAGRFVQRLINKDKDGNVLFPASTNQKYLTYAELFAEKKD